MPAVGAADGFVVDVDPVAVVLSTEGADPQHRTNLQPASQGECWPFYWCTHNPPARPRYRTCSEGLDTIFSFFASSSAKLAEVRTAHL